MSAAELTVVVAVGEDPAGLRRSLESLCEQSVEDFSVLVVQRGAHAQTAAVVREYCDEYVGFSAVETPDCLLPEAFNAGAAAAESPLLLFMAAGDYLAPESVESILKTEKETGADIVCPRLYISGENEPYYNEWADQLATVPHADRFDRALLNTLDAAGRVYKKKFFDLYAVRFPASPVLFRTAFTAECVLKCGATVSGCAGAIYDDSHGVFAAGYAPDEAPGSRNLARVIEVWDDIVTTVRALLEEETAGFDGDEYTYQESLFVYFTELTERFYRRFWYLTDEDLQVLLRKYEAISEQMTKERREKMKTAFADLRFPSMYMKREDAARLPMVSLLAEFPGTPETTAFVHSLYDGRFPFFELFLREGNRPFVPEKWAACENLHFLPDEGFFAAARRDSLSLTISVRDAAPLDPKVLPELAVVKAPRSMYQYIFASKRKKYSAKTFLKKKGMNLR